MENKDSKIPLVSVIMATYNEPADIVQKSIQSIMNQSFDHLELIIADDSTESETINAIDILAANDYRIHVIRKERRMGFVTALNTALQHAKGTLIARMDGDDISLTDRISLQVSFAQSHPDIDLFGGSMYIIDKEDHIISERNYPVTSWGIYRMFLYRSPFAHPTIMFRRSIIDNGFYYDPSYKKAEDIDFYIRLYKYGFKFGNIPQKIIKYRTSGNMANKRSKEQWIFNHRARKKFIARKPMFSILSYTISELYKHIPIFVVSSIYKKEYHKYKISKK